jgi:hypothetical protein
MHPTTDLRPESIDDRGAATASSPRFPVFLVTFGVAWVTLDRLVTSPPTVVSATVSLAAAAVVLVVGELVLSHTAPRDLVRRLGLGRPTIRALAAAALVGGAVFATYVVLAAVLGIDVVLRDNWPAVLAGSLLFHGVAEELVWRGYAFGHLRRTATFRRAVVRVVPLLALTHVPIMVTAGVGVGALAVVSAAVTCVPLATLWERGGGTIWAPAMLHGLIGTWQLFERSYGAAFHLVILLTSIGVPLGACAFGDRWYRASAPVASAR